MAQTAGYFHAAYIIAVLLYGSYAAGIWIRRRAVRRRRERVEHGAR